MSFPTIAAMSIAWWACRRRRSAATTPRESPSPKPIFSENVEDVTECYERIVATGAPVLDPVPFLERWRGYRGAESLFLPLSNAGVAVNLILVFFDLEAVVRFTGPAVTGADTGEQMMTHDVEEGGVIIRGKFEVTVGDQVRLLGPRRRFGISAS